MDFFNESKPDGTTKALSTRSNGTDTNYNSISYIGETRGRRLSSDNVCVFDNPAFTKEGKPSELVNDHQNKSVPLQMYNVVERNYDPHDYGNADNPTSFWGTVLHVIIISAGPAILSIPIASNGVGYLLSFVLSPFLIFLYVHNVHMVVWSEYQICKLNRVPSFSYSEVVYHAFKNGPVSVRWFSYYGKFISYLIFTVIWFCACCYNYVIICQNLQVFLLNIFAWDMSNQVLFIILLMPLLLLCWVPKLSYLVPFSFVGNIFNWITIVLVLYYILVDPSPWNSPNPIGSVGSIPLFIGTVMFTLNATGIMIPLKNDMKNPKKFDSNLGVLRISYLPVSLLFSFFSLICSLKYGSNLKSSVIENLPPEAYLAQLGILLSTITLIIQFPLIMYVPFDVIWNNILKETKKRAKNPLLWQYSLKTGLVILSYIVSSTIPDVSLFLSLSGTVGTSIDSFIFPAFMQTLVMWKVSKNKSKFSWILIKNALIVSLAIVFVVAGTIDCIRRISYNASQ